MATSRRRFSAIAGISLLSVFFLAISYTRVKTPLSPMLSNDIAVQKDLIEHDVNVISENGAVVYHTDSPVKAPATEMKGSSKNIPRPTPLNHQPTKSTQKLIGKLSNSKALLAIKHITDKKLNLNFSNKPDIELSHVNHYSQNGGINSKVLASSTTLDSKNDDTDSKFLSNSADQLYDEELTTTEGSTELSTSAQPKYSASLNDIENRKHQYWLSGNQNLPYNSSLVTQRQVERKKRIHEMCQEPNVIDALHIPSDGHRSSFFRYEHLLYCPILKAGSTNILRLMCWLRGPPCSEIKHLMPHNMVPRYLEKSGNIAVRNSPEFLNYFSFALVRNPWKRLVSVYIQKFVETRQGLSFCGIRDRYPRLYRHYRSHKEERMKFKDYLEKCVIGQYKEGGILAQNGHWRPQYHMCSFCFLDFTFIGKIETMKSDERVILNAFGFSDIDQTIVDANSHLLPNEKANKTTLLYEDLWGAIDPKTIEYLKKLYAIDLEMFNYPTHPLTVDKP